MRYISPACTGSDDVITARTRHKPESRVILIDGGDVALCSDNIGCAVVTSQISKRHRTVNVTD